MSQPDQNGHTLSTSRDGNGVRNEEVVNDNDTECVLPGVSRKETSDNSDVFNGGTMAHGSRTGRRGTVARLVKTHRVTTHSTTGQVACRVTTQRLHNSHVLNRIAKSFKDMDSTLSEARKSEKQPSDIHSSERYTDITAAGPRKDVNADNHRKRDKECAENAMQHPGPEKDNQNDGRNSRDEQEGNVQEYQQQQEGNENNDRDGPEDVEEIQCVNEDNVEEDDERDQDFEPIRKRRKYVHHNRPIRTKPRPSNKRERFMKHGNVDASSFTGTICCKRKQCFRTVNMDHMLDTAKLVMNMSQAERKKSLTNMLTNTNVFVFDGHPVCTEFLVKAFRFSRDLQCAVKGTAGTESLQVQCSTNRDTAACRVKDAVVVFLRRIADQTANAMPNSKELHLPFYDKQEVYKLFCPQYKAIEKKKPPTLAYFYRVWKESVPHIKIRRVTKFTLCGTCESYKVELRNGVTNATRMSEIQNARKAHYDLVATERQAYKINQDNAKLNPSEYMSLVLDGADQSAFGLPHFVTITKDTKGHCIKVKLIGILEHGPQNRAALYTMTENFETGANHVIECLHRYLNKRNDQAGLPNRLTIQLDNCTRENKNRYMMAYLESLVSWGVFVEVQASFLPIGHTHSDIDQLFSRTATRLHTHDAVTIAELHEQLGVSYTPHPHLEHINNIANFSGLCEATNVLWSCRRRTFSEFRYFNFCRTNHNFQERLGNRTHKTKCLVKVNSMDDWEDLRTNWKGEGYGGFITDIPDLRKTPPVKLVSPPNLIQVMKRLDSEETRINDMGKMESLKALVDEIYQTQEKEFSWDQEEDIESKRQASNEKGVLEEDTVTNDISELDYEENTFVAVRQDEPCCDDLFWIGKISRVLRNENGKVEKLTVQWYERKPGEDSFTGKYRPSNKTPHGRRFTSWMSDIHPKSVSVTFPRLAEKFYLCSETKKKIRNNLGQS